MDLCGALIPVIACCLYIRNKIRPFTHMDIQQTLSLISKLVCSCQTRELHMKHTQLLMCDSEKSVNTCESQHLSAQFELSSTVHTYININATSVAGTF